ncbi:MBL fold metallo-hydrolase [Leptospira sp. GIMC2001]|uniref:MBL fold metallo-hydrolase n=1 Tax=Leptospira sp. GIMC2001 TaxID=1513297 RepID=UPI0004A5C33E|nr:MBL fold metallo-hydrolase [Leptospira sp. GIMC2001]AID56166.1 metallo-beta-lactamase family protein [Leptospira sp. GIMC2001]WCL49999.1 MBL fold metallo-hydrolase [Leptospira sp. GIMC2001]
MIIHHFFDKITSTLTYILWDEESKEGIVIDPVLDYIQVGSIVHTSSLEVLTDFIRDNSIELKFILETHAHADHISAAPFLKKIHSKARIGIGSNITQVQEVFRNIFQVPELVCDGSQFDFLLRDGDEIQIGKSKLRAIHTPGHTPACMSYYIDDKIFVGDAIFLHDYGTGRCDFPLGSASTLYRSIQEKIYTLPDSTEIYVGHDYQPNGREMKFKTTVGESKKLNIQLSSNRSEIDFVEFRKTRDSGLAAPKLLYESVYCNINGGGLPHYDKNSKPYFKIPVNLRDDRGYLSEKN